MNATAKTLADHIQDQVNESASELLRHGWEGGGSGYDIGTYYGDGERLAERLGRPLTRDEFASLEYQTRRILDAKMADHTPAD